MKRIISLFTIISILILATLYSSCYFVSPQDCLEHDGYGTCKKCGLNYFEEFSSVIKSKATTSENGEYIVEVKTDSVDVSISYNVSEKITLFLTYKSADVPVAIFLLTIKPNTGTTYGWALSSVGKTESNKLGALKMANGTFNAEDVNGLVYNPPIDTTEFSQQEFEPFVCYYETSISFCIDMIHSILNGNENHLTISNLGFCNYTPNV